MKMEKVVSSNVEEVGFDAQKQQMVVRFKGGSLYLYDSVSEEMHKDLMGAKSVGSTIRKVISGLKYERLTDEQEKELLGTVAEKPVSVKKAIAKHSPGTHVNMLNWVLAVLELLPGVSPVDLPKDKCYKKAIKAGDQYYSGMFFNSARTEGVIKGFTTDELDAVNSENAIIDMQNSLFYFVKLK